MKRNMEIALATCVAAMLTTLFVQKRGRVERIAPSEYEALADNAEFVAMPDGRTARARYSWQLA